MVMYLKLEGNDEDLRDFDDKIYYRSAYNRLASRYLIKLQVELAGRRIFQ